MSYILDALKKSDKERQKGQVPDLHAEQDFPRPEPRKLPRWPYVLAVVLLLNGAFLLWTLKPWHEKGAENIDNNKIQEKAEYAGSQQAIPENISPGPKDDVTGARDDSKVAESSSASPSPAGGAVEKNIQMASAPAADEKQNAALPEAQIQPDAQSISQEKSPSFPGPVTENQKRAADNIGLSGSARVKMADAAEKALAALPAEPDAELEQIEKMITELEKTESLPEDQGMLSTPAGDTSVQEAESAADASPPVDTDKKKVVFEYEQLPPATRQEVPEIIISLHYYSRRPAARKVNINGRLMREGQKLDKQLILEEIVPDGVVFNLKGTRFRVGVF